MLSKREKGLLVALFWAMRAAAAFVTVYFAPEERGALSGRIRLAERELATLSTLPAAEATAGSAAAAAGSGSEAVLVARIAEARSRLYAPGEIDPVRFGIIIRDLLLAEGLAIARYQTVEQGSATALEFSIEGSARSVARFLRRVSESPKWWAVSFLSLRSGGGDGSVQAVLRIHYEQEGKTDR